MTLRWGDDNPPRLRSLTGDVPYRPSSRELARWATYHYLVGIGMYSDWPGAPVVREFGRAPRLRPRRDWGRALGLALAFIGGAAVWGGLIGLVLRWNGI